VATHAAGFQSMLEGSTCIKKTNIYKAQNPNLQNGCALSFVEEEPRLKSGREQRYFLAFFILCRKMTRFCLSINFGSWMKISLRDM